LHRPPFEDFAGTGQGDTPPAVGDVTLAKRTTPGPGNPIVSSNQACYTEANGIHV